MVLDIKMVDFWWKTRLVAGGHMTKAPTEGFLLMLNVSTRRKRQVKCLCKGNINTTYLVGKYPEIVLSSNKMKKHQNKEHREQKQRIQGRWQKELTGLHINIFYCTIAQFFPIYFRNVSTSYTFSFNSSLYFVMVLFHAYMV